MVIYKLYFRNSYNQEKFLTECKNKEEVFNQINKFLDRNNYISYYTRIWYDTKENRTYFDVGSHSEFFFINGKISMEK